MKYKSLAILKFDNKIFTFSCEYLLALNIVIIFHDYQ